MFKGICVALGLAKHGIEIRDSSYQWWPPSGKLDQPDPADGVLAGVSALSNPSRGITQNR